MTQICAPCSTTNRPVARFCKKCGIRLVSGKVERLDDLVGMEDVKDEIGKIVTQMETLKNVGMNYSDRLHMILVGNTGVGKTKLLNILAGLYHRNGVTVQDAPVIYDAVDFADFSKNFLDNYKKTKGKILCIENVHKLIPSKDDQSVNQLDRIFLEMSKQENRYDPIIILSGQPYGLREYLNEHVAVKSKFRWIFTIPDFNAVQLTQLTETDLAGHGFSLPEDAKDRLMKVYKHILKQDRMPDAEPEAKNGWLSQKMAENIRMNYWLRVSMAGEKTRIIAPEDIKGNLDKELTLEQVLTDLDMMIGMAGIKSAIRGLIDEINQAKILEAEMGAAQKKPEFHVVLTGNPGTGKTVIARKLGEIFRAMGLLELGHVVEVDRGKVVGQYVGQTAPNVNALCDKAMGGVLFIDEVYTLKQSDNDQFGQEAIDTLLKRMEDDRGKFIVVVAGYRDKMNDFMRANDGLRSRFKEQYSFHIDDYNAEELLAIFKKMATEESNRLSPEAEEQLGKHFASICSMKDKSFGNGRGARNIYDECKTKRTKRIKTLMEQADFDRQELTCIRSEDLPLSESGKKDIETILGELDKLIGLAAVKKEVRSLISFLKVEKIRAERGGKETRLNLHFLFRGNPGTGKTTVARILAGVFREMGLLSKGHLVEVDRSGLVGQYMGDTAKKTDVAVDNAMGGVLFVDEAYSLVGDQYGIEAINKLLKRMEDDKGKFIVIAAGYFREMEDFLNSNSGLTSRFTKFIDFEDYTPEEMMAIFRFMVSDKMMTLDELAEQRVEGILRNKYENRDSNFANGRTVRNIFEQSLQNQSSRIGPIVMSGAVTPELINTLIAEDIPERG